MKAGDKMIDNLPKNITVAYLTEGRIEVSNRVFECPFCGQISQGTVDYKTFNREQEAILF